MNILVIGGGGREHALAWKALQSPLARRVFVAPGNAGTALEPGLTNVPIAAEAIDELLGFARAEAVDLTIVGPEAPLVLGVTDAFTAAGLKCLGPSREAARLEGSKSFAKDFLARHGVPIAAYGSFTELEPALAYLRHMGAPIVIKADGLAAGKGVILAQDQAQAEAAVRDMLSADRFGEAGRRVVIEELLRGEEASFIALVDGEQVLPLASSQDHKAVGDGDTGPNTGGMGAYSPAPVVTPEIHDRVMAEVMLPTVRGMAAEGRPYLGFLYAGLMIGTNGTPRVLEFNCRCGDPETQPILLRLRTDLVTLCLAALEGRLDQVQAAWDPRPALAVVLAAGGYPGSYAKGHPISGLASVEAEDAKVFHAGTALADGRVVTAGGRVLCVTALGATVADAQRRAYGVAAGIHWQNLYYRHDIGHRAVAREAAD
jgi:phosphoribosylamine---glycine ligase